MVEPPVEPGDKSGVNPTTTTTTITGTGTNTGKGLGASHLPLAEIFDLWNELGPKKCLVVSDKRRRQLQARWREMFFREHWRQAIKIISESKFCRGGGDRGWVASFDWFVQPDTVAKVMEGKYSGQTARAKRIAV